MASTNYELGSSTRLEEIKRNRYYLFNQQGGYTTSVVAFSSLILCGAYFWKKFNTYNKVPRVFGTVVMAWMLSGVITQFVGANVQSYLPERIDRQYEQIGKDNKIYRFRDLLQ